MTRPPEEGLTKLSGLKTKLKSKIIQFYFRVNTQKMTSTELTTENKNMFSDITCCQYDDCGMCSAFIRHTICQELQKELKDVKKILEELKTLCPDSILQAWVNLDVEIEEREKSDDEEEDYIADCSRCNYRFYEHTTGRDDITLLCDCGMICKTCLTEKERGQLDEWDEEDWDTELLCCEVQGFECCVCESVMVSVVKNM